MDDFAILIRMAIRAGGPAALAKIEKANVKGNPSVHEVYEILKGCFSKNEIVKLTADKIYYQTMFSKESEERSPDRINQE